MNPELEEQLELERLIAEQEKDDSGVEFNHESGHRDDVSLEAVGDSAYVVDTYFAGTEDEHSSYDEEIRPAIERGSVLSGSASWHGTITGYRKHGCRCVRCKEAQRVHQSEWRRKKRETAA